MPFLVHQSHRDMRVRQATPSLFPHGRKVAHLDVRRLPLRRPEWLGIDFHSVSVIGAAVAQRCPWAGPILR